MPPPIRVAIYVSVRLFRAFTFRFRFTFPPEKSDLVAITILCPDAAFRRRVISPFHTQQKEQPYDCLHSRRGINSRSPCRIWSAETEQALARAVSPVCEVEVGENTDSPLAVRSVLVHRDSREILGARGEGRFPTKEKMSAFFRESLISELAKRKTQLMERPRDKPLVVYSNQHPFDGKMIVETSSGLNSDGTITIVVALSQAPPPHDQPPQ